MRKRTPLQTAKRKGIVAFRMGFQESDCPYPDTLKADGKVTFSRSFRNAWFEGYREEMKIGKPKQNGTRQRKARASAVAQASQ